MTALTPGHYPQPVVLEGRYCRLEPLAPDHATGLFAAVSGEGADERFRYLGNAYPPQSEEALADEIAEGDEGRVTFAVLDAKTGICGGRQSLMNIAAEHRSIELGAVLWGRGVARTRIATEALFLTACHVFEDLGYRRFEWKCNALNLPSRQAALRFGFRFEGIFRNHMILKGESRDTAWFSIIDTEWPGLKPAYEAWLSPDNFEAGGTARTRLATPRE